MSNLIDAAKAVVARWDSPLWKDQPHTGEFIDALRRAVESELSRELAVPDVDSIGIAIVTFLDENDYSVNWRDRGNIELLAQYVYEQIAAPITSDAAVPDERNAFEQWFIQSGFTKYKDSVLAGFEFGLSLRKQGKQLAFPITSYAAVLTQLDEYDAGSMNDYGGGNVSWWHDYIRNLLGCAYDFYNEQLAAPSAPAAEEQIEKQLSSTSEKVAFIVAAVEAVMGNGRSHLSASITPNNILVDDDDSFSVLVTIDVRPIEGDSKTLPYQTYIQVDIVDGEAVLIWGEDDEQSLTTANFYADLFFNSLPLDEAESNSQPAQVVPDRYLVEDCHGPRMYISQSPVNIEGYRCTPLPPTGIEG